MIHIVLGPPCAGKSTYIREHAKAGDLRVDFDLIAQTLGAGSSHEAEGIVKEAAFAARDAIIKVALKNPEAESWIIHTSPNADQMNAYKNAGAEIIELDPGIEVCLERALADERPQRNIDAIHAWYSARKDGGLMLTKSFNVKSNENGTIEGYASTWDLEPDSYGDVVKKGAFAKSLEKWRASGKSIPLLWSHRMDDLNSFIGTCEADEDDRGLHFVGTFDNTPEAQRARELYKDGRLSKFSFAFDVLDAGPITLADGTKANELRELEIFEISCVTVPANSHAEVIDVKDGECNVKVGKRNSKADADVLKQIIDLAQSLLGEIEQVNDNAPEDNSAEDSSMVNGAPEEPEKSNAKEHLLAFIKTIEN